MASVSSSDWFKVQGWMVTDLHLRLGELATYALVHTFTRPKEGKLYTGGVPYLAEFLGVHPDTAREYLHNLADKGLIVPVKGDVNGVPFIHYKTPENSEGTHPRKNQGIPPKNAGDTPENSEGKQKYKQKDKHNLPKEEKKSTKKETFTDSIVRQWQNKQ